MNIFIVPMFYKEKQNPEKAIFIYEQAKALMRKKHNVVVLAVKPATDTEGIKGRIEYVYDEGIHTYYISFPQSLCSDRDFTEDYLKEYVDQLESLIKYAEYHHGRADVIYAHFSLIAGYAAAIIASRYRYPLVIEEHHSRIMTDQLGVHDMEVLGQAVMGADEFICVSNNLKNAVLRKTGLHKSIRVVSNMISDSFRYFPRTKKHYFRFFSLGNLFYRKGFDLLIKAFAEEFLPGDPVELIIGGSGPEEMALKELIDSWCHNSRIKLIGHLDREQTIEEYRKCDCFVLPSRCEAYGLVYREAMAVGRPVITTNHGGISPEEWNVALGIMTDVDDKEQLKKALRRMYVDYSVYDLDKISVNCLKQCRADIIIAQIEEILIAATGKTH